MNKIIDSCSISGEERDLKSNRKKIKREVILKTGWMKLL